MIILDTNVISALMYPHLNAGVVAWLDRQPEFSVWATAITILEVRSGILLLPVGRRRRELDHAFDRLFSGMLSERIVSFDAIAAEEAARINAQRVSTGRTVETRDTQIAGIVLSRNATLATRNVKHFADLDIRIVNPWVD